MTYILAIDQGTTSSRAIVFDQKMQPVASAQEEFEQLFPASGWVEHRPSDIWETVLSTCKAALAEAGISGAELAGIGIANQRETTLLWDRGTGVPLHNAIVWQDRRTAALCEQLKNEGLEEQISYATGLLLDPYFSGTKLAWLLDNVEGARARAQSGELAFGTVDSWLLWNLTGGHVHATDATNAARTLLYDIREGAWSEDICALLDVPLSLLPEVRDCASEFGSCELFGKPVPVLGIAGDQQAATIGQGCFSAGMMKSTYGTGCFALLNTGAAPVRSQNRLLTTIAYQFDGVPAYALEGSIFVAGAVVQWLRDGLKLIEEAKETQGLAEEAEEGVILVPAFTGLGAPFWNAGCRGAVFGLTRNSGPREMARAALESVGFQTRDLLEAMRDDWARSGADLSETALRVDGGMTASDWTMQFLSDMTGAQVDRPVILETTALGVAWLAGHRAGLYPDQEGFARMWQLDRSFKPQMDLRERDKKYAGWQRAVAAAQSV